MTNRYYHYICSDEEKEIYATILEGLMDYQEVISFRKAPVPTPAVISKVFKMVLYDNPRIFYTSTLGQRIGYNGVAAALYPKYFFPLDSVLQLQEWLDERVEEICAPIRGLEDPFSKEIYIHNYLIEKVKYSFTDVAQPVNAYTVAGTLLENNSVCAGVALSFKLLMDHLDIPCIVATGTATNGAGVTERHAWNLVYLDGAYYQIDVTWDLLNERNDRLIKYDFFNLTTQEMYQSRRGDYDYPLCTEQAYNYFSYMKAIVTSPEELASFVSRHVLKGEQRIYFKYTFDTAAMKHKLNRVLSIVPHLCRYQYWVKESVQTVFIMRI